MPHDESPTKGRDYVLGRMELYAQALKNQVKGNLMGWRPRYIKQFYGEAGLRALADSVGPEARSCLLDRPTSFSWVPVGPMYEIDRALVEGPMEGDIKKIRHFAKYVSNTDLSTIYKLFVRIAGNPGLVCARLPSALTTYFKPAVGEINFSGSSREQFVVNDFVMPLYMCRDCVTTWFEEAILLTGEARAVVLHDKCIHKGDDCCRWRWSGS